VQSLNSQAKGAVNLAATEGTTKEDEAAEGDTGVGRLALKLPETVLIFVGLLLPGGVGGGRVVGRVGAAVNSIYFG